MSGKRLRVGINGLGRIGRAILRINHFRGDVFDLVVVNDINPDTNNMQYLINYDTVYGKFDGVDLEDINVYHKQHIEDVPWHSHQCDLVIDSCGVSNKQYHLVTTDHIIFTHDNEDGANTVIFGVNEDKVRKDCFAYSGSICDTVALAPILKEIERTHKIESGFLTTLHPWLSYQNLTDGPSKSWSIPGDIFSHYALGRSSAQNIIPKSTSAVTAADRVLPGTSDKIHSFSYRVPTPVVCGATLNLKLSDRIDRDEVVNRFEQAEATQKYHVFQNSVEPLTSTDYTGNTASVIIDHRWTLVSKDNLRLCYWYDNEWGYSSRIVDIVTWLCES